MASSISCLLLLVNICSAGACKLDGISITSDGLIFAAKGGSYAIVKPEEILQEKIAFPSDLGFSSIDAFAVGPSNEILFAKGGEYVYYKNDVKAGPIAFPNEVKKLGFTKVDAMTYLPDGTLIFAQDGKYSEFKNGTAPTAKKDVPKIAGFEKFDAMASTFDDLPSFVFVKGSQYVVVDKDGATDPACLPSVLTTNGFDTLDGMSFDSNNDVWVAKDGHYMAVKPGKIVTAKTAFPSQFTDNGFSSFDSVHIDTSVKPNVMYVTKGSDYMAVDENGEIKTEKTAFPKELTDKGFTSVQGMFVDSSGTLCVAKNGEYMCCDGQECDGNKKTFPTAFTDAGFSAIDGMHIDSSNTVTLVQDGYYMSINEAGKVVAKKTMLPSTLTDAMCGATSGCAYKKSDGTIVAAGSGSSTVDEEIKKKAGDLVSDASDPQVLLPFVIVLLASVGYN